MLTRLHLALLVAALASGVAMPAHAQRARVFVASYGNDSNPCSFLSPCRTFQIAHDNAAAKGEITAIDSAGFGSLTITKAITITTPAGIEASIATSSAQTAITINAGSTDVVSLRGLTLNGGGIGQNGIVFNSGSALNVSDCNISNFVGQG